MFPITMTFTVMNPAQLASLYAAASGENTPAPVNKPAAAAKPTEKVEAKKEAAATAPAATQTTAVEPVAQETKAPTSESTAAPVTLTTDERAVLVKAKVASAGRDAVVALLAEFGAKNASSITDPVKLAEFDAKLKALA